jgi:protoporphyrinogen oxidase
MGYIQGGSAVLVRALADAIASGNGEIYLSCPAQAVYCCSGERRLAVASLRGELHADVLVLAVPLAIAARLTAAAFPQWSAALARIPTTAVVCGLFRLARHITSYFWVNINDKRVQLNGFIEYSNLNAAADTWGGEILYAPTYLGSDDSRLLWSDEKWTEWFSQNLSILCPDFGDLVTATVISRDLYAQPVCAPGFAAQVPPIHGPVPGLFLVEATQLYPSDRTISGMIGLATQAAKLATEHPLT